MRPSRLQRPIAIFQHETSQGPGYLLQFLQQQEIPYRLFHPAEGQALPRQAADYSGLVLLGSNRSANDDTHLPWVAAELQLLRDALAWDVPVLGHCFGAQLLARALGAQVRPNARPQIGWNRLTVTPAARALFGGASQTLAFNWHYEGFEIPRGAQRILFGRHSLNKGFVAGPHLGLQAHLEVTPASVRAWCAEGRHELQRPGETVQDETELLRDLEQRCAVLHRSARQVYAQWIAGLPGYGAADEAAGRLRALRATPSISSASTMKASRRLLEAATAPIAAGPIRMPA